MHKMPGCEFLKHEITSKNVAQCQKCEIDTQHTNILCVIGENNIYQQILEAFKRYMGKYHAIKKQVSGFWTCIYRFL